MKHETSYQIHTVLTNMKPVDKFHQLNRVAVT